MGLAATPNVQPAELNWRSTHETAQTLANAVSRVRSFAGRGDDYEPIRVDSDHTLRFVLQGQPYDVATRQWWPSSVDAFREQAAEWLADASAGNGRPMSEGVIRVHVGFFTPRIEPPAPPHLAGDLLRESRALPTSAAAFSFPSEGEYLRYHYANEGNPGVLLLALARGEGGQVLI